MLYLSTAVSQYPGDRGGRSCRAVATIVSAPAPVERIGGLPEMAKVAIATEMHYACCSPKSLLSCISHTVNTLPVNEGCRASYPRDNGDHQSAFKMIAASGRLQQEEKKNMQCSPGRLNIATRNAHAVQGS